MGQQQYYDGPGMMGQRGGQFVARDGFGGFPNGGAAVDGTCPDTGPGMMGQRGGCQGGVQNDTGVCPNGDACPGVTDDVTSES
jgi:hypothetical protein